MRLLCLDCEATGTDPRSDRIVQFFAGVLDEGEWIDRIELIVNPGVLIPKEAVDVHGITNERARTTGVKPITAMPQIREFLARYRDLPFVIMNARYDVPLVNSELERNGLKRLPNDRIHFIDPLVIDRGRDRYRKGKRKLENLAEHYGVPFDPAKAHDASYDCLIAGQVAEKQIAAGMPSNAAQAKWHREWAEHFEEWIRNENKDDTIVIEREWPE